MALFTSIDVIDHIAGVEFCRRSPEKRVEPFDTQIAYESIIESEEHVCGEAPFRLRFALSPFIPEGREQGVFGIETISRSKLLPELPSSSV
jgi:hypothetical protein